MWVFSHADSPIIYLLEGDGERSIKISKKGIIRVPLVVLKGDRSLRIVRKRDSTKFFWQQEPPNFRVHATMHLIMILIRWLVGLLCSGRSVACGVWHSVSVKAGAICFSPDLNGANYSGVDKMRVNLISVDLNSNGFLGLHPALAVISTHGRGRSRINTLPPDYSLVDTPPLCPNFPLPVPRAWG